MKKRLYAMRKFQLPTRLNLFLHPPHTTQNNTQNNNKQHHPLLSPASLRLTHRDKQILIKCRLFKLSLSSPQMLFPPRKFVYKLTFFGSYSRDDSENMCVSVCTRVCEAPQA